jgi:hydroxymethylglutaryl-CoA lyase
MSLPKSVTLVEVGPRDGLQNEPEALGVADRITLIDRLTEAGLRFIEAGSFVSPRHVPQMANTEKVLAGIQRQDPVRYQVLVPNMKGFEAAQSAGATDIAIFAAASETFSQRNINCSISEGLTRFAAVCEAAQQSNIRVRGYVSCVLGCPYEGDVSPDLVADLAHRLTDLGCYEISLGDTIGIGTAGKAQALVDAVAARVPVEQLAAHFHETYGQALANIFAVMERGISVIDCSVAGLGGCPFSPGATGNVATEDVLYMLDGLGIETGVDLSAVAEAGRFVMKKLGRPPESRVNRALAARQAR